jgi:CheY-like chemotaxis protein
MVDIEFCDLSTVIMFPNHNLTASVRSALVVHGIQNVTVCDTVAKMETILPSTMPDLIICELIEPTDELLNLVRSIRLGGHGCNSFCIVVAITENTHSDFIQKALNSGFDDVIAEPINIGTVLKRLVHLAHRRKPFAITSDYIGPDRRYDAEVSGNRLKIAELVEAPNPLNPEGIDLSTVKPFEDAIGNIRPSYLGHLRHNKYNEIRNRVGGLIEHLGGKTDSVDLRPRAPELKDMLVSYCDIFDRGALKELTREDDRLLELINDINEHHMESWKDDFDILHGLMEMVKQAHKN